MLVAFLPVPTESRCTLVGLRMCKSLHAYANISQYTVCSKQFYKPIDLLWSHNTTYSYITPV